MADIAITEQVRALLDGHQPLQILTAGHPVLRAEAAPYDGQLEEVLLAELIEAMRQAMKAAPGVGLAAPQIGLGLALAVIEDSGLGDNDANVRAIAAIRERAPLPFQVLINPQYEPVGKERVSFYEGCLSIPGYQGVRSRYRSITASFQDGSGIAHCEVLTGWPARIFQHETDHLRGELYLDKAELRSLSTTDFPWGIPADPGAAASALGFSLR